MNTLSKTFENLRVWDGYWHLLGQMLPFSAPIGEPDAMWHLRDVQRAGAFDRGVSLRTSGTEGYPKRVEVPWGTILNSVGKPLGFDERWLLTYSLERFAGIQVLAHCLVHYQGLVIPRDAKNARMTARDAIDSGANCISCTPSWMRHFLMSVPIETLKDIPFRQVTLGGEHSSQRILDDVHSVWPNARVTHIYASTEAGTCFAVSDGLEGIPLKQLHHGRNYKIGVISEQTGELKIYHNGEEILTGDFFDVRGDRAYFVSRRGEFINVGGYKVGPAYVESVLSQVPDIEDIRVYGKRNPLVGECVAVDVVSDNPEIEHILTQYAREHLAKPERPMVIRVVEQIERSAAGKTLRRKE